MFVKLLLRFYEAAAALPLKIIIIAEIKTIKFKEKKDGGYPNMLRGHPGCH